MSILLFCLIQIAVLRKRLFCFLVQLAKLDLKRKSVMPQSLKHPPGRVREGFDPLRKGIELCRPLTVVQLSTSLSDGISSARIFIIVGSKHEPYSTHPAGKPLLNRAMRS